MYKYEVTGSGDLQNPKRLWHTQCTHGVLAPRADLPVWGSDPVLNGSARFGPAPDPEPDRRSGSPTNPEPRTEPRSGSGRFGSGPKFGTKLRQPYSCDDIDDRLMVGAVLLGCADEDSTYLSKRMLVNTPKGRDNRDPFSPGCHPLDGPVLPACINFIRCQCYKVLNRTP